MAAPRVMTANTLNALKGWPRPSAVDFEAEFDADIPDADKPVMAGSVLHLNASGKYELGVGTTNVMPLFLFQNSDDPDVVNEAGDPSTDVGVFVPINPTGVAMTLVAIGAYELVSTAFVDDNYAPNDLLSSDLSGGADPGLLKAGTLGTDLICGVVSRGKIDNGYGHEALAFWPVMFPVYP